MERNYWKLYWKLFSDVLLLKRRFYFTCDITSDVSIAANWNWHFEAAIRTIIIITVGSGEQATEANTVASTQLDIADIDSM